MENIDQLHMIGLKKTWIYRILNNLPYVKKVAFPIVVGIFPWLAIRELISSLNSIRNENLLLSETVDNLRNNNARLMFEQKATLVFQQNEISRIPLDEIAGLLNWPEVLVDADRMNGFGGLIRLLSLFSNEENSVSSPSSCWILLAVKNLDQLLEHGYKNFKRTIGHNYFNFLVQKGDPQIQAAESLFPTTIVESCRNAALSIPHDSTFSTSEQFSYNYFILLLWEYVKKIDIHNYLDKVSEPKEGNPLLVSSNGKSMSQDLANSLIEYYSISEAVSFENIKTVLEIGGGYGRNAHVILSLNPNARVILVDIMPALYIAQRYLSSVFRDRKVFAARSFSSYDEVKNEIEAASIVFLLPHQITLLPDKQVDLCMNISSFGEMNREQIEWYFAQINRFTSKYFYMKQWNISQNPFDGLILNKSDYICPESWKEIYSRNCAIQTEFFETVYQVNN